MKHQLLKVLSQKIKRYCTLPKLSLFRTEGVTNMALLTFFYDNRSDVRVSGCNVHTYLRYYSTTLGVN